MMGILTRFRRLPPEPALPSIYEHIRVHVPPDGSPGLLEAGYDLPDEELVSGGGLRWAPGAMDGVATHHGMLGGLTGWKLSRARSKVVALMRRAASGEERDLRLLEAELARTEVLDLAFSSLYDELPDSRMSADDIARVGWWLVRESGRRNAVKIGLVLTSSIEGEVDPRDIYLTIGRHDEFTLYAAEALAAHADDQEAASWELAKVATGWGRVFMVERLADTERPEIRDWILRHGFRNKVMFEYLAPIAAETGGLVHALERDDVDEELLTAACEIITALIDAGPTAGIDGYGDGPRALELLVGLLGTRATTLDHLLAAGRIERFLLEDDEAWSFRHGSGWSPDLRERLRNACADVKERPEWVHLAKAGLEATDQFEYDQANKAARLLGIDTFEADFERVAADPLTFEWYRLVQDQPDRGRIERAVELAERTLPLAEIATGPTDELGLGQEFVAHEALVAVIHALKPHPGLGWSLIAVSLRSPVIRNRYAVVQALHAWGRDRWPDEAADALSAASRIEPDRELRHDMQLILEGKPPRYG